MTDQTDSKSKMIYARLPDNVVPSHYFITIRPNLNDFTFSGSETVNVNVEKATKTIVINASKIEIQSASFVANDQEHKSISIELIESEEVAIISFADEIQVGSGELKLQFSGSISATMVGCYRSKYNTPEGETRYGLSTQFESVYCRKAFPCFDEPALKAKFDLTLVAPKDRVALSNMEVAQETDDELDSSKKVVKFATTPIMSTYLLAYVIGEYEYIEAHSKNGVRLRVYTLPGKTEQGRFALDVAVRCLDFYEDYFKIKFPLPKCDLIAIADFQAGAMENWGLITYREVVLLFDPDNSSSRAKQFIAIVVCHELAHQWFGNLVTMKWWDDLWLNEGFASFMEYYTVDHLLPEYNIWEEFVTSAVCGALNLDAMRNSHPIEVPVLRANDIEEIFDVVTYEKGASIIQMLFHYIGNHDFQEGLHNYMKKFMYRNAVTEDLWGAFEEQSKKPVKSIMSTWTRQMGYPLITVTARQNGSNRVLTLQQEKFSIDGVVSEKDQTKWMVPISIISQNNPKPIKMLLEDTVQEIVIENVEPNEWIKINPNMISFYRVAYPPELLDSLLLGILDKSLSPIDRLSVHSDLFALVEAGKISSDRLLKLMESYLNEDKYIVWDSIISCLSRYNTLLDYTDFQEIFHIYVRKLLSKIHAKLGYKPIPGEDHQTALLRGMVIGFLVTVKDPQVLQEARAQFDAHVSKLSPIAPDLRNAVYRAIAAGNDDKAYEQIYQLYRETDLHEEKNRLARSLSSSKDLGRIQRLIDFAMSDEVRNQDAIFLLGSLSNSHKIGRDVVWNYFKENHNRFKETYGSGGLLARLVKFFPENFASEERLQEVAAFFDAHPLPGTARTVKQTLESIKLNADLLARDTQNIKNYLINESQL